MKYTVRWYLSLLFVSLAEDGEMEIIMTELEAISYIENHTWSSTRLGLERTRQLLLLLGDPQKKLKFVHVAGSNGKGSTCAMLESILRHAGYRTGLYTSPHLVNFNERFMIDGQMVSSEAFARTTERVKDMADQMDDHPSQFEISTAIAMLLFLEASCDIVVLEVGLGGELDSTNIIDSPEVAVIANIGLEHTEYLGSTIEEIATTKAGIVKSGCSAVCYDSSSEAISVISRICQERDVPLHIADFSQLEPISQSLDGQAFCWHGTSYHLPLLGLHQLKNAAVALEAISVLVSRSWKISDEAIRSGLAGTSWRARLEVLAYEPIFILDGGHNPQCTTALCDVLSDIFPDTKVTFLIGILADKNYHIMLETLLPHASRFICVTPDSPRALPATSLVEEIKKITSLEATSYDSIDEAICASLDSASPVVAFGSLYMAGSILGRFDSIYKKWLRRRKINIRVALDSVTRAIHSEKIASILAETAEFRSASTIMLYRATRSEVDLKSLEDICRAHGKRLVYPLCTSDTDMVALCPHSDEAWQIGYHGIEEPIREQSSLVEPRDIDLVICPCTVFDEGCRRMGMGAGFYDRYLKSCTHAKFIAVAYECQKTTLIRPEPWDMVMDMVVTESGVYVPN